jgi:hypothetical protein
MSFEKFIQLIKKGEPVSPGTPNRPLGQLDSNIKYVWDVLQAAELGSTVYARQVTVESTVVVGSAVYYNPTTQQFEKGLAQVTTDTDTGVIMTSQTSQVWGIVAEKHNSTLADLLLFGYAEIDISPAVTGGTVVAGGYYLSGVAYGELAAQSPPVSVPVLRSDGNGHVFVNPKFVDFLDSHKHYKYELTTLPAGTHSPPTVGENHVITAADSDLPGWLPADDAIFDGKAPPLAAFGYNLSQHASLNNAWPPLPLNQTYIDWDKGEHKDEMFHGVPMGLDGLVHVTRDGIWWMSNCYGDVPWPTNWDTSDPAFDSVSESIECPRDLDMLINLYFTQMNFATDQTVVTSLISADDRLVVRCAGTTTVNSTGDLEIDLDLDLSLGVTTKRGALVFKELNDDKFDRGYVVEGVYKTSENVTITSDVATTSYLVDGDSSTPVVRHGMIGIEVSTDLTRELSSQLVRLDSVTEEFYQDVMYLGMPADEYTSFVTKIYVPSDITADTPTLTFRLRLLGRAAGTLPQLTIKYRIQNRPTGLTTATTLPSSATTLLSTEMDTTGDDTSANFVVEAISDAISVAAGDLIFFEVIRDGTDASDAYSAQVGILQQSGVVSG